MSKPAAEVSLTADVARALLDQQFPEYAQWDLSYLDSGWDNCLYRLGETLVVRLPRRQIAAELILQEQSQMPILAQRLAIPIPVPVHIGQPQDDYPWNWSIIPWFDGQGADLAFPASDQAERLADFLISLHQKASADRAVHGLRGVPLSVRDGKFTERLNRLKQDGHVVPAYIEALWQEGLRANAQFEHRWIHGDLHAQNVVVHNNKIAAVIDWGDLTSGDVATDVASAWTLFATSDARQAFIDCYSPDDALLARAKAWAAFFALFMLYSGLENNPRHARQGRLIIGRLVEDV